MKRIVLSICVIALVWCVNTPTASSNPLYQLPVQKSCGPNLADFSFNEAGVSAADRKEIEGIYERLKSSLTNRKPRDKEFNANLKKYNSFKITGSGEDSKSPKKIDVREAGQVLHVFARYIKHGSDSTKINDIRQKAINLIHVVGQQFCDGISKREPRPQLFNYSFRHWAKGVIAFRDDLDQSAKDKFGYSLQLASGGWDGLKKSFKGEYLVSLSDWIFGLTEAYLGYGTFLDDRQAGPYMAAFKRHLESVLQYSPKTKGMFKPDGSSYHHDNDYIGYMYSFQPIATALYALGNTTYQVEAEHYKIFRKALLYQAINSNDNGIIPLSAVGRNPHIRKITAYPQTFIEAAIAGGNILNLPHGDPVLAPMINRMYGKKTQLKLDSVARFETGFYQFNHALRSVYRRDNWVASMAGFSQKRWGAEIYPGINFYGRYQSYGTLEVIYPGSLAKNGFSLNTWNWNHNPGTTSILLAYNDLHAEKSRLDEKQSHNFVGGLAFQASDSLLTKGVYGMFAMRFQEKTNQGFRKPWHKETHNNTFTFNKTYFAFDDMIIALGSEISNQHAKGNTITTLFQRSTNQSRNIYLGENQVNSAIDTTMMTHELNYIISNYGTGFYLPGNQTARITIQDQQTPNHNQNLSRNWTKNGMEQYATAYLDHGLNPTNMGFEFVCLPGTNPDAIKEFHDRMQNPSTKPYTILQKDSLAHILTHEDSKAQGYALFRGNHTLSKEYGIIKRSNSPCLIMYQPIGNGNILLAINNPDISTADGALKKIQLSLYGEWSLAAKYESAGLVQSNTNESIIQFATKDGMPIEIELIPEG